MLGKMKGEGWGEGKAVGKHFCGQCPVITLNGGVHPLLQAHPSSLIPSLKEEESGTQLPHGSFLPSALLWQNVQPLMGRPLLTKPSL